jgi:RNA polymerase sigma factor (sigma-70 family)
MDEAREPGPSSRWVELLRRWRSGDSRALEELLTELQPWLHQEMSKALGNQPRGLQDSLDLAQTAVKEFLEWSPRFLPENDAQFRVLLRRIARNGLVDAQRRPPRRGRALHASSEDSDSQGAASPAARSSLQPSRVAEREENAAWVRLALQFLDPDERYLLLASEVDGLSWAQIATTLGLASPDAARVRGARLKSRLAAVLLGLRSGRMPEEG